MLVYPTFASKGDPCFRFPTEEHIPLTLWLLNAATIWFVWEPNRGCLRRWEGKSLSIRGDLQASVQNRTIRSNIECKDIHTNRDRLHTVAMLDEILFYYTFYCGHKTTKRWFKQTVHTIRCHRYLCLRGELMKYRMKNPWQLRRDLFQYITKVSNYQAI